jgi:hypothetical protein
MKRLVWCAAIVCLGACGAVDNGSPDAAGGDAAPADAATPEVCTPSAIGSTPADEDGDGAVDEGCPWHFGTPHWMPPIDGAPEERRMVEPNWVSPDGLRLYLVSTVVGSSRVIVQSRTARGEAFDTGTELTGMSFGNYSVIGITLSDDELEAFVVARPVGTTDQTDLFRMIRGTRTQPFGAFEELDALSTPESEERPMLRADGKELLFASNRVLKRALRDGPRGVFGPAEDVLGVPTSGVNAPQLSRDGRTLFLYRAPEGRPFRIYRAERSDVASATFGDPVEVEELEPSGQHSVFHPVISEATREMFFGSSQPWSPTHYAVWRAEMCRDGGCAPRLVPCAGVRSPDGQHCYTRLDALLVESAAEAACALTGGHLVSVHSQAEQDLVWSRFGGEHLWLGGFDDRLPAVPECNTRGLDGSPAQCAWAWESGEHTTFAAWGRAADGTYVEPQEQGEEDCAVMFNSYTGGLWADITCTYPAGFRGVCETSVVPTW